MDPSDAHMKGKWMWEQKRQTLILPELVKSRRAMGLPGSARGKEPAGQCRKHRRYGFDPSVGKTPWKRK